MCYLHSLAVKRYNGVWVDGLERSIPLDFFFFWLFCCSDGLRANGPGLGSTYALMNLKWFTDNLWIAKIFIFYFFVINDKRIIEYFYFFFFEWHRNIFPLARQAKWIFHYNDVFREPEKKVQFIALKLVLAIHLYNMKE